MVARAAAGQAAEQGDRDGQAGRGRREVADREDARLGEVRRPGLAGVVLPVGVGLEADRGVERELRRHGRDAALVERQDVLEAEHDVAGDDGDERHDEHRDGVPAPALLGGLVDAADAVDRPLDGPKDRAQEDALALHDPVDVGAQQRRDDEEGDGEGERGRRGLRCAMAQKSSGRRSAHSRYTNTNAAARPGQDLEDVHRRTPVAQGEVAGERDDGAGEDHEDLEIGHGCSWGSSGWVSRSIVATSVSSGNGLGR